MSKKTQKDTNKPWSQTQAEKLALYMWLSPRANLEDQAKHIGVSRNTYYKYRQDEQFIEAVNGASRAIFNAAKSKVDAAVVGNALTAKGSADRKLYYQLLGELVEKREDTIKVPGKVTFEIEDADGDE